MLNKEDIKYEHDKFNFAYRVASVIYNNDKSKILLFKGKTMNYYMLPGGKVKELEKSNDAIKREISEEIGWKDLKYKVIGVGEDIIHENNKNIHEITILYETVYKNDIIILKFNGLESNWIGFEWVDIQSLDNYYIHIQNVSLLKS